MQVVHEFVALAAHAAALTHLIERVGSYAGFAAVVGLAVLAALYFSQARDVKRLREWAGRAPERAAELQQGGRTAQAAAVRTGQPTGGTVSPAQPVARPTTQPGAQPATAGTQQHGLPPKPATAPVTAGGAKPATAVRPAAAPATASAGNAAAAATPAGAAASAAGAAPATAAAGAAAKPATATGQTAAPARPGTGQTPAVSRPATGQTAAPAARPATAPGARPGTAAPARGNTGTGAKVLPARPAQTQRPRPIPAMSGRSGQTAVIPPPRKERRWTAPRYLVLIVAGVIVLGLGGTVGFLALTGDNGNSKKKTPATVPLPKGQSKPAKKPRKPAAPPIDPSTVTVSVLNGTQVTGLAGTTGQKVVAAGFRLGTVATASQSAPRAESVVLYRPGSNREARAVARKLGISQIEPIDSASEDLAGPATVVVVVGSDRAGD